MFENFRGEYRENISLSEYSSWRAGGLASRLYKPTDLKDLSNFLNALPQDEPLLWLGLGSNTLIRDGGFLGTVIITQGRLKELHLLNNHKENYIIRAEAGVACATLARFSARQNLKGLEFLAGIPGTMGGALCMNAGCFNGQTWDRVISVETIDRQGNILIQTPQDFDVAYRFVKPHDKIQERWFVAGTFRLDKGDKEESLDIIRTLLERRMATQPINEANCGSVFRNPPNDYAARLIESCGLKGYSIGRAKVSDKHANFIINEGQGCALDIENLIEHVQKVVQEKTGIKLIREVHIVGNMAG